MIRADYIDTRVPGTANYRPRTAEEDAADEDQARRDRITQLILAQQGVINPTPGELRGEEVTSDPASEAAAAAMGGPPANTVNSDMVGMNTANSPGLNTGSLSAVTGVVNASPGGFMSGNLAPGYGVPGDMGIPGSGLLQGGYTTTNQAAKGDFAPGPPPGWNPDESVGLLTEQDQNAVNNDISNALASVMSQYGQPDAPSPSPSMAFNSDESGAPTGGFTGPGFGGGFTGGFSSTDATAGPVGFGDPGGFAGTFGGDIAGGLGMGFSSGYDAGVAAGMAAAGVGLGGEGGAGISGEGGGVGVGDGASGGFSGGVDAGGGGNDAGASW